MCMLHGMPLLVAASPVRSEEHTSELQSQSNLVCRLLLEKKTRLYVLPMFILGALATGFVVMVRAITADVGDELRLQGGRDLMGVLYAVTSATTKAAGAMS